MPYIARAVQESSIAAEPYIESVELLLYFRDQHFPRRLAATLPASIIIPTAFAASAMPPASVTVKVDWRKVKEQSASGRRRVTVRLVGRMGSVFMCVLPSQA